MGYVRVLAAAACIAAATSVAEARVTTIAPSGTAVGQVQKPDGIAIDRNGHVVVADAGNARGQVFGPDGAPLLTFGGPGMADGQLGDGSDSRLSVAVGANGHYYVGSPATGSIHRYRADGSFVSRWGVSGGTYGLAALASGDIFALTWDSVARYTADGTLLGSWPIADGFDADSGPALDIAGAGDRLYVLARTGEESKAILVYDAAGTELTRWTHPDEGFWQVGGLHRAEGIGTDPSGNVYAVGGGGAAATVVKFDGTGKHLGTWPAPPREHTGPPHRACDLWRVGTWEGYPPGATDVAVGPDGNIWLVEAIGVVSRLDLRPVIVLDWAGDQGVGIPAGSVLRLDASLSYAPFEPVTWFEWDIDGDGAFERHTGTAPTVSFAYNESGIYNPTVRATGASGQSQTASHRFWIVPWGPTMTTTPTMTGYPVTITADATQLCSTIERYEWDLDNDGAFERDTGTVGAVSATFTTPGPKRVGMRAIRVGGHVVDAYRVQDVYPAPPAGWPGISINGGARYTRSRAVTIDLVWPEFSGRALVSNDSGFADARKVELSPSIKWRLPAGEPSRRPRVVHVRFTDGATFNGEQTADTTFEDEIVLDKGAPRVTGARRVGGHRGRHDLRIRARDAISGVERVQVAVRKRRPGRWRPFTERVSVRTGAEEVFVRVADRAGNVSRWRAVGL